MIIVLFPDGCLAFQTIPFLCNMINLSNESLWLVGCEGGGWAPRGAARRRARRVDRRPSLARGLRGCAPGASRFWAPHLGVGAVLETCVFTRRLLARD